MLMMKIIIIFPKWIVHLYNNRFITEVKSCILYYRLVNIDQDEKK